MQDEIEQAAYEYAKAVESGDEVVVGVNKFVEEDAREPGAFPLDPSLQEAQIERLRALRASRDPAGVDAAIDDVRAAARGTQNLLVPMREALRRRATLGEVSDALREVFGEYRPNR
jgi:methylmalonyl-CoA mutase N-terminal domain/subunit